MIFLFDDTLDAPVKKGRKAHYNPRPPVPETGWKRPTGFPDLSGANAVCWDFESKDLELKDAGPGWGRGAGHPVGIAVATDDGYKAYYPVAHEDTPEDNFPADEVKMWMGEQLAHHGQWDVFWNGLYDWGWFLEWGLKVHPSRRVWDGWIAEKLIRHQNSASLEDSGQRRIGKGKKSTLMLQWIHKYFGRGPMPNDDEDLDDALKRFIYATPPSLAGPYAEEDAVLPLEMENIQRKLMEHRGLIEVFNLECQLIPLLAAMRFRGVRVDIPAAEKADGEITAALEELHREIKHLAGRTVEVNSGEDVGRLLTANGIKVPLTPKTQKPSIKDDFLEALDLPVAEKISEARELIKFQSTFVRGAVMNKSVKSRIHSSFNPLRAITGRFSSTTPNLQNLPSRNPKLAPVIRSIFTPDEGHHHYRKYDYASIESRMLAHFAVGKNSEALREEYCNNPKTDYHNFTTEMVKRETGLSLPRKSIKNVNFAICYGAGDNKLARMLKLPKAEVEPFFNSYHTGLPYVRSTLDHYSALTGKTGFTQTIMGRRVEFDEWEPAFWQEGVERRSYSYDEAIQRFGARICRANLYCAVNYIFQGSAADIIKSAMLKCLKDGVFDYTGNPLLQVHDELTYSAPDDSADTQEAFAEMKRIMETVLTFKVPIRVSAEKGSTWGTCEEF